MIRKTFIANNSAHGSDLDIVRKSRKNRIRQLEDEQKRASIAIIKAREIRQKNWAKYSNQTISIRQGDQNYNVVQRQKRQTWHDDTEMLNRYKLWFTHIQSQLSFVIPIGESRNGKYWLHYNGNKKMGFLIRTDR